MFMSVKKYGPGWRPAFSGIVAVGWLIFIIAWLAFFSADIHPYEKKIAIVLLSTLILVVLLGGVWGIWAVRMIPKPGRDMMKFLGFRSRMIASIIVPLASIGFLVYYFWYYDFTVWQHIAVIFIAILAIGLVLSMVWASWKKGMCEDFEEKMEGIGEEIEKKFEEAFDEEK